MMNKVSTQDRPSPRIVNERNHGIDLFRVLLALMVLSLHFNAGGIGKVLNNATEVPWKWIAGGVTALCYPAVNCYVLISGFFMYKQKASLRKQMRSLSKLWLAILFYSLIGYIVVVTIFGKDFSWIELLRRFFPVSRGVWWFFTVYFALAILSPFMNAMIDALDKAYHRMLILLLLIMCSIIPMFTNWEGQLGSNYGYSLLWFFVLYVTGAYISRYISGLIKNSNRRKVSLAEVIVFFICSSIVFCSGPILRKLGIALSPLAPYNSLITYVQSISLLLFFMNVKVNEKFAKIIADISGLSLASYMFHCQEDINSVLWSNLKPWEYANSSMIIIVFLVTVVALYTVSILIEFVRNMVVGMTGLDEIVGGLTDCILTRVIKALNR